MRQKADTHVHTQYSGYSKLGVMKFPESVTSPEAQVDNARRNGMSVLAITDHDEIAGAFVAQKYARQFDDIDVVAGDEVMTSDGEIIGLWLNEKIKPMMTVEESIDAIRDQGGITIAPHPFSFHVAGLNDKIYGLDLDGFEVINGGHVDPYSNRYAQAVMGKYPGRWAAMSSSDAHSKYTAGYNWTEFEGQGEDDFRKAILNKSTVPCGRPAPVIGEVQWSIEVVLGGQKLMGKALRGELEPVEEDHLIEKILSITDLKKATGIFGGSMYLYSGAVMLATVLSTTYLNRKAKKLIRDMPMRLANTGSLVRPLDN
jgi:predicted metal-dependent phosphoesterase TrpH